MKEGNKMEDKKYYISTAIAYTSGKPHIGPKWPAEALRPAQR